jgi:hypothetical protein
VYRNSADNLEHLDEGVHIRWGVSIPLPDGRSVTETAYSPGGARIDADELRTAGFPDAKPVYRLITVGPWQDRPDAGQHGIKIVWEDGQVCYRDYEDRADAERRAAEYNDADSTTGTATVVSRPFNIGSWSEETPQASSAQARTAVQERLAAIVECGKDRTSLEDFLSIAADTGRSREWVREEMRRLVDSPTPEEYSLQVCAAPPAGMYLIVRPDPDVLNTVDLADVLYQ